MTERTWRGLVFIGMSVDGYIARSDGSFDWLVERGELAGDAGYTPFMERVDAVLMGRATYEVVAGMGEWPFAGRLVLVLSTSMLSESDPRVEVVRSLDQASETLTERGATGVYIDGARTIQSALQADLVDELTLSRVTVLLGRGIQLFAALRDDIPLEHVSTEVLGGGMVQSTYRVVRHQTPSA